MSVLDSNTEDRMKGEKCGQFSIQQNQAKYSPYLWWRAFNFAVHHPYKKNHTFFQFPEHVVKNWSNKIIFGLIFR